jgi:5-methyltetrahydrofolate--homocysteine methyltransferase
MGNSLLVEAFAHLKEKEVAQLIKSEIDTGKETLTIVEELRKGMDIVGERYKNGDYFLSELIISGQIFKDSMEVLEPRLRAARGAEKVSKFVLGTVKGDVHDIGKDIVAILFKAFGFEVYDLGVDVPPSAFVDKLLETEAPILGMSGLLTPSFTSMKKTIEAIKAAGLREKVKIIVGGGIVDEKVKEFTGADSFTSNAIEGIQICEEYAQREEDEQEDNDLRRTNRDRN